MQSEEEEEEAVPAKRFRLKRGAARASGAEAAKRQQRTEVGRSTLPGIRQTNILLIIPYY